MAVVCSESLSSGPKSHCKELQQSSKAVSVWKGMGTRAARSNHVQITWKHHVFIILLFVLFLASQGMTFLSLLSFCHIRANMMGNNYEILNVVYLHLCDTLFLQHGHNVGS